jgi:hypothetical protein
MTTIGITALSASDQFISTPYPNNGKRPPHNEGSYKGCNDERFSPVPHGYSGVGSTSGASGSFAAFCIA